MGGMMGDTTNDSQYAIHNSQFLLCLKGHPGTGKSTLAQSLCRHLRWPLIDKDDIKDHTWDLAEGNALSYAILWQIVETQLRNGLSVIVDSPFARPHLYETAQQLAELDQQQESINQQIEDLMEALLEDANSQDVLEESQRERARDADDSIAMIQEPAVQMNRAMEKAQESESGEQQAKELAQAAEQQEKTDEKRRIVGEQNDAGEDHDVNQDQRHRYVRCL